MDLKVSIITATYNSKATLELCLESVKSQNYEHIEHIIIDGDSKDQTYNLIKKVAQNNPKIIGVSEPDKGIYDALNKGIAMASGDIIGFVHSDDLLANNNTISDMIEVFKANNCDGVYADLQYVEKLNTNKVIRYWKSCDFNDRLLKKGWMPAHPTLFLKKDVYKKHGNFNINYKIAADYDFMLRVLKDKSLKFLYLPIVVTKMRVGGASNRSLKNLIIKTKEDYQVIRNNKVGNWFTVLQKNLSKVTQFFIKY